MRQFKVADVSGDGAPDVMVTSTVYGEAESHTETGLLLNDGNGALTLDQTIVEFGKSYENIAAADLLIRQTYLHNLSQLFPGIKIICEGERPTNRVHFATEAFI